MTDCPYVSRGGLKLAAALDAFEIDPTERVCADLGANVGGFTDCLLMRGAAKVYAVDTAYGQFAWKLRQDPRVKVFERTNALHFEPTTINGFAGCDLVVIDLGWTRQSRALPVALKWLKADSAARIVTLIKPHYELGERGKTVLDDDQARRVCDTVLESIPAVGLEVLGHIVSPIRGGGSRKGRGNVEYLAMLGQP